MLGAEAVGQYAVAVRLSEAWYFIPVAITASLFPAIILVREKSEQRYHQQLQALFDGLVWLAILIALPMTFFSTYIVEMLFGAQYSQAGDVLAIHMWAAVFVFLGCALGRSFVVENRQTLNFYRNLSGLATNIVLNFLLIPVLGIKGAALATLVSYSVSTYLILPLFNDGRRQFILASKSLFPLRRLSHRKSYD
jgi:O-antigen/teichoic acid export membrane protein